MGTVCPSVSRSKHFSPVPTSNAAGLSGSSHTVPPPAPVAEVLDVEVDTEVPPPAPAVSAASPQWRQRSEPRSTGTKTRGEAEAREEEERMMAGRIQQRPPAGLRQGRSFVPVLPGSGVSPVPLGLTGSGVAALP